MSVMENKKHENMLNKCSEIWDRTEKLIGKVLDHEVIHKN